MLTVSPGVITVVLSAFTSSHASDFCSGTVSRGCPESSGPEGRTTGLQAAIRISAANNVVFFICYENCSKKSGKDLVTQAGSSMVTGPSAPMEAIRMAIAIR